MEKKEQIKYSKNLIIRSKSHFSGVERDMLSMILKDGTEYSIDECKAILDKESRRKVK